MIEPDKDRVFMLTSTIIGISVVCETRKEMIQSGRAFFFARREQGAGDDVDYFVHGHVDLWIRDVREWRRGKGSVCGRSGIVRDVGGQRDVWPDKG